MKGNTSSPAITRVTAGDAFSPPCRPTARTPAPSAANCRLAKPYLLHAKSIPFARQNHTFGHAKPYVSQTRYAHTAWRGGSHGHTRAARRSKKTETAKESEATNWLPVNTLSQQKKNFCLKKTYTLPFCQSTLCLAERSYAWKSFQPLPFRQRTTAKPKPLYNSKERAAKPSLPPIIINSNLLLLERKEPQSPLFPRNMAKPKTPCLWKKG